jgi:CRP-like cAMP-binding protein
VPSAAFVSLIGIKEGVIPNQSKSKAASGNHLLASLPATERQRLEPFLEPFSLTLGETIYKVNSPIDYVYFPDSGVLSMLGMDGVEDPVEVGLLGPEGLAGLPLFLGVSHSANEVIVQGEGSAKRINAEVALAEFRRVGAFHNAVLRFAHDLFLQVSATTSCNRHHEVEARLSRWLLMMRDRVEGDTLQLTQQFLSWMLGVRNQAVSKAAISLHKSGSINYSRGQVRIVNRKQLERSACPCYRLMATHTDGYTSPPQ